MSQSNRQTITIDKVVTGGHGLSRLASGLVVMVPFVLPGERVVVRVDKEHKGFALASLLEVLDPSPQRVEPLCPHFQACGGCHLQHGDYPLQLAIKDSILRDLLSAHRGEGACKEMVSQCEPILSSPLPFHYRQRVRIQVDGRGRLGFFARRSHDVVEIDACPLAKDELNQVLADLRGLAAFRNVTAQALAVEFLLSPVEGRVVMLVHLSRKPRAADQQAARAVADALGLVQSLWLTGEGFAASGPYGAGSEGLASSAIAFALPEDLGGRRLELRLEAGGFCQVNLSQNERLVRQLLAWAEVGANDSVLDLFCGMGNFSLPLALNARQVVGTDLQRSSIRGAEANAQANGLVNCRFLRTDAAGAARDLQKAGERFDLILLDPPRAGCREILPLLSGLGAAKLIYISCDPATLCRDLRQLQGLGFALRKIRGVDMFPQTCHIETIALLTRA